MPTRARVLEKSKRQAKTVKLKLNKTIKKKQRKRSFDANESIDDDDLEFQSISDDVDVSSKSASNGHRRGKTPMLQRIVGLTQTLKTRGRHLIIPGLNLNALPLQDYEQLQNYPTCKFITAQPIHVAKRACATVDLCHLRTHNYDLHKQRLNGTRTHYVRQLAKNKNLTELEQHDVYSNHVYTFAERLNCNPVPYFYGCYDFYYTGGNVAVLPDAQHILHADGKNLNTLKYSKLTNALSAKQQLQLVCAESYDEASSEIFEMRAFPTVNAETENFIVRQLSELTLHGVTHASLESTDDPIIDSLFVFRAKVPFISFTHVPEQWNLLLSSNMRQQLRLYDLAAGEARLKQQFNINNTAAKQSFVSCWNTVRGYNENTCVYANDEQLLVVDLRTTQEQWLRTICPTTQNVFDCDRISCLAISQWQPLFYVGTAHHLHCLDLRKLNMETATDSAVCTWTHQMAYPPAFIDTFVYNETEIVAISSAIAGEVRVCEIHKKALAWKATCLPYKPTTLKEAYHHAQLNGRCLQAAANLQQRLNCCTTGLTFLQKNYQQTQQSNYITELLISNSHGDVFAQGVLQKSAEELQEKEQRVNEFSVSVMQEFEQTICQATQPVLNYTDICDMQGLNKVFRCLALSKNADDGMDETCSRRRLGRWQKSAAALRQFKDALAQDLLSIWDVEDERAEDWSTADLSKDINNRLPTKTLVHNWLDLGTLIPPATCNIMPNLINNLHTEDMQLQPQSTQITEVQLLPTQQNEILPVGQAHLNEIKQEINTHKDVETVLNQTSFDEIFTSVPDNASLPAVFATIDEKTFLTQDPAFSFLNQSTNANKTKKKSTTKTKRKQFVKGFG